jgi:hypothetical protein
MRVIAGPDGGNRSVEIFDDGTLHILRLKAFPRPSTSGGAAISEAATHTAVIAGAGKQGIEFLDGTLCATKPELQHAAHLGRQLLILEQALDGAAVELEQHL